MHHFRGSANTLVDCLQEVAFVVDEPDVFVSLPSVTMLGRGWEVTTTSVTVTGDA